MSLLPPLSWPVNWQYALGEPTQTAGFKQYCEDFQVRENLGFEPFGKGEHVFLDITKIGTNTSYLARQLSNLAGVPQRQVSYSGLKDRHAITRQWLAVHLPGKAHLEPDWSQLNGDNVHIHQIIRHNKKLRIGVHQSNDFQVILRDIADPSDVETRMQKIANQGVPNYFGHQRFGHDGDNLKLAHALCQGRRIKDRFKRTMAISAVRAYLFNCLLSKHLGNKDWLQAKAHERFVFSDGYSQFFATADQQTQERVDKGEISPLGWLAGRIGRAADSAPSHIEEHLLSAYTPWQDALDALGVTAGRRPLRLMPLNLQWRWLSKGVLELRFRLLRGSYATSIVRELTHS